MTAPAETDKDAVARIVRQTIASILPILPAAGVAGDKSLKDQGADSVDRVEIILAIMSRFGMDEPMANFSNIATVDELVDYICRARRT